MPTRTGKSAALVVAHVAGMIDLVALPVWVGTLMQHFQFDAQQAGALVTLYLLFAVACCALLASCAPSPSGDSGDPDADVMGTWASRQALPTLVGICTVIIMRIAFPLH